VRFLVLAVTLALVGAPVSAEAKVKSSSSSSSDKKSKKKSSKKDDKKKKKRRMHDREVKRCRMVEIKGKRKKRCKYIPNIEGRGVAQSSLRTEPLPRPSGELAFEPNNKPGQIFRGNIFAEDGDFDDAVLADFDRGMVCKRTGDIRAVDPRLYQTLSTIYDHFGKKTMVLVSGHRLQTKESGRHHHASAADIYIPGVSLDELYAFAESLDTGGMGLGLYPRSGFIHVDWRAPGAPSYRWTDWYGGMQMRAAREQRREKARKARNAETSRRRRNNS
jgi:hypothetical protein